MKFQYIPMDAPNVKIDIKLQLAPSNFILRKHLMQHPMLMSISLRQYFLLQKQQVMSSVALAIEKLRASGNNIKLLVPHTIANQRHIVTGSSTYTDSSFIDGKIPSKHALSFVKSASAIGSWTSSPHEFELFGSSSLVCKEMEFLSTVCSLLNPIGPYMN